MTEVEDQAPPAQDAVETIIKETLIEAQNVKDKVDDKENEENEVSDKFEEVGAKHQHVEKIKKNYGNKNFRKRTESWSQKDHQLSRALAGILRHGMMGFQPDEEGFLFLEDILRHHHFKDTLKVSEDDLKRVGELEDKKSNKMFELVHDGKHWKMRARASTVTGVEVSLKMANEYPACIHGTWWKAWEDMKLKGISRLGRNPIHFCSGLIVKDGHVPGIRANCEVLVYIDLHRVIKDKVKFFRDEDGVLSTHGNKAGVISPKYFTHAIHVSPTTGQQIYNEDLSNLRGLEGQAHESARPQRGAPGAGGRGRGNGRGRGRGGRGRGSYRPDSRASENRPDGDNPEPNNAGGEEGNQQKPKNNRPRRNRNRNKGPKDGPSKEKIDEDVAKPEKVETEEVQITEKVQELTVADK